MTRHFTIIFFAIAILFHSHSGLAQTATPTPYTPEAKISKAQLQKDFLVFRKSLEEAEASLYRYADKKTVDRTFEAALPAINRDMTEREFYQVLTLVLSKIGDGHSNAFLSSNFRNYISQSAKMLPLKLRFLNGKAYVLTSPVQTVAAGWELRSINGLPMSRISRDVFRHLTSDGAIETGKFWKLNEQFSRYYYLFIGQPDRFWVECYDRSRKTRKTIEIPAMSQN